MKTKLANTCTKLSIAIFCVSILGYSVCNDCSFQEIMVENRLNNHAIDSLLQQNSGLLYSLRSYSKVMNDSLSRHMCEIDSTLQKHINTVENTAKRQNSMLNQISRKLNQ